MFSDRKQKALDESIRAWMETFARAVRERDFERGRELCSPDIYSFGTVCRAADTLESLESEQWQQVWPRTSGFDFVYGEAREIREGSLVVILSPWVSSADDESASDLSRRGRATIVLAQSNNNWKALHTHFSMNPDSDS